MSYWTSSAPLISSEIKPGNASATAKKANVTIASMTDLPLPWPGHTPASDGCTMPEDDCGQCDADHRRVDFRLGARRGGKNPDRPAPKALKRTYCEPRTNHVHCLARWGTPAFVVGPPNPGHKEWSNGQRRRATSR